MEVGITESELFDLIMGQGASWKSVGAQVAELAVKVIFRILWALATAGFGMLIIKFFNWMMERSLKKLPAASSTVRSWMHNLITALLWVILAMIVLDVLGLSALSVASFVLSLGVATGPIVTNLVAGILVICFRKIKVGDHIVMKDKVEGKVIAIDMLDTELETTNDILVIIPNSALITGVVWNQTRIKQRRLIAQRRSTGIGKKIIQSITGASNNKGKEHVSDYDDDDEEGTPEATLNSSTSINLRNQQNNDSINERTPLVTVPNSDGIIAAGLALPQQGQQQQGEQTPPSSPPQTEINIQ